MRYCVAIVEDEAAAAQELEAALVRYGAENGAEFTVSRFADAGGFLRLYEPVYDLVFMDIRMPGLDGMTAAQRLRAQDPVVPLVFVTSLVQFAVQGYEVEALDFIVKPVRYPAFRMKLRRILRAVEARRRQGVVLHVDGAAKVLELSEITYIEVRNHDLTWHTTKGEYTVRGKLSDAEKQLPADRFFRCAAAYLINLRYAERVSAEDVEVAGTRIRVSRAKKKELMAALAGFLGKEG